MIWDLPTRLFHWLFAICLLGAYITGEEEIMDWHARFGVTIFGLMVFRIIWGLVGPKAVRFSTLFGAISDLPAYIRSFPNSSHSKMRGHNPLGALSVLAFLIIALVMATTGLFNEDDIIFTGPLYYTAPELSGIAHNIHEIFQAPIIPLILLHLAAIIFHRVVLDKYIIKRITTGIDYSEGAAPQGKSFQTGVTISGISIMAICLASSYMLLFIN
jgi:cytochrome b